MLFEWDESKRQANLAKHPIDFQDARSIFDGPRFGKAENRQGRIAWSQSALWRASKS
jgi:uncharacterized DUF497 family protein